MNRINRLFQEKPKGILSVYFCAGTPTLDGTVATIEALQANGIDMVEIGMPFSDPLADGPVIQAAATRALQNGMNLHRLFEQLQDIRRTVRIPLILMGYYNVALQYGMERFFADCRRCGIDGCILPDLPFEEYRRQYLTMADEAGVKVIFLVTPETSEERIRQIDELTDGFIYAVSSASVTGMQSSFSDAKQAYFSRLEAMHLRNPHLIGFGISNLATRQAADRHAHGVIVGSKFVTLLETAGEADTATKQLLAALHE